MCDAPGGGTGEPSDLQNPRDALEEGFGEHQPPGAEQTHEDERGTSTCVQKERRDHSQPSVDDDGVRFDREAEDSGIIGRVSERDLLAFCVLLWEKADFRNAVILERRESDVEYQNVTKMN